jgi:hypothetical protein
VLACLVLLIAAPGIASAALGEMELSVDADAARASGTVKILAHAGYRTHEIHAASGTLLREFVGPDGRVFAVAWNGPAMPNLRETLGRYFGSFAAAARLPHAGHNRLDLAQDNLVVQSSGHMRAFVGRAYLASAVPAGVDVGDLR